MPAHDADLALMRNKIHDRFRQLLGDAAFRNIPQLHRHVLGRRSDQVIVEGAPLDVHHGGAMPRYRRGVMLDGSDLQSQMPTFVKDERMAA